jgi:hypothetical protein
MVESSFAPAPGAQANDALRRLLRRRLAPSDGTPVRGPNLGFLAIREQPHDPRRRLPGSEQRRRRRNARAAQLRA